MENGSNKRVSSKDVAKAAGVSQSTVSRVYNESGIPVSEDKRIKVLETAEKLGYRPSLIARSLNQQSTRIIGIVVRHFNSSVYMKALEQFIRLFQNKGYTTMVFNIQEGHEVENNLKTALEYQVAGLIITSATISSPLVEGCLRYNTPVFLFNRLSDGMQVNTVCHNNEEGGELVAELLVRKGHHRLVYVSGEKSSSTNRDRQKGFLARAEKLGIKKIKVIDGDYSYQSGFDAAKLLIEERAVFDGVLCASDYMAMGFYDYLRKHSSLSIPEDVSLVGFDGISLFNDEMYPITTYQQPLEKMVENTVDQLINKINNFSPEPVHFIYSGKLIERGSVKDRLE
jgi:DNA-binding LacI/PurR family transcriptional regulator